MSRFPHPSPEGPDPPVLLGYDWHVFGLDTVVVLLIILGVVLVWRGPRMLPRWGAVLGRGVKAARKEASGLRGNSDDVDGAGQP